MKQVWDILRDAHAHGGRRLALLLLLLVVTGVSDGISMALLYPLLQLIGMGGGATSGQGTVGAAVHAVTGWLGLAPTLTGIALLLAGSFLLQAILVMSQNWLLFDMQKKYVAAWQERLVSDFLAADWSYFAGQKHGHLVNLVLVECPRLGGALFGILQLVVAGVVLCIYLVVAVVVSWKVTLFLAAGSLVLLALGRPIRRATRRYGGELAQINADVATTLNEVLSGAKLIKASASEAKANASVAEQIERLRRNLTWSAFLPSTTRSFFEFFAIVMILSAVLYGLKVQHIAAAELLVIVALIGRLLPRLAQIQQFNSMVILSAPAYPLLRDIHNGFAAHREIGRARPAAPRRLDLALPVSISARDLVVRYGDSTVLDGVSFTIPGGQVAGFVGRSGAGKSTLVDAIIGLVQPREGELSIGGVPLRAIDLAAWRERIGYVSQDTFLFHDTIANNIRWSTPGASMEAVEAAARQAGLAPFIAGLPQRYETIVGDRGVKLSGGQRQRISLARALIRAPALLVLDEPTSALDSISEQEVMNVINTLRGKITIIIVAHRLSTLRDSDLIYVMDHGRIVEQGSWSGLSERKAAFHRLLQSQTLGDPIGQ